MILPRTFTAAILALLLTACTATDGTTQPADAIDTAVQPAAGAKATVQPAEMTEAPVTVVTAIPTSGIVTPKTGPIGAAMIKFGSVSAYRAELEMQGKGALGLTDEENEKSDQEVTLFTVTGDFVGADASYTIKGFLSTLLGVDAAKGLQAMLISGKGYVKGPVAMLGAMDSKWYVLDVDQSEAIAPPFLATEFLTALVDSNINPNTFKKTSSEKLDGKTCDVYSANSEEAIKALGALNSGVLPGIGDMATITGAEADFSVCNDGYLHRVRMLMDTVDNENKDLKSTYIVTMRMRDFNASIKLVAPANAEPLVLPDFGGGDEPATP